MVIRYSEIITEYSLTLAINYFPRYALELKLVEN